jgi:hypothetical protein
MIYVTGITGPVVAIIAGTILRFAVHVQTWWWAAHGWWISVTTLGDILLIGGVAWLALALALEGSRRSQNRRQHQEQLQREERRDSVSAQAQDTDWRNIRDLERARSASRIALRGMGGRKRGDDDE